MDIPETLNMDFIDAQYKLWKTDPNSVSRDWHFFFEGFELASTGMQRADAVCDEDHAMRQSRVESLIYRYRDLGHLMACLDPLATCPAEHPLLELTAFDLTPADLDIEFYTPPFSKTKRAVLRDVLTALKETYCGSIGIEYMHMQDPEEREWLQERMEPNRNRPELGKSYNLRILNKLYQSVLFEQFLNKKYLGQTRFSLEGADVIIPMLDVLVFHMAEQGCREIILGMSHRGRLNVQANVLEKTYEDTFGEFESCYDPENLIGAGDVKYHNGYLADIKTANDRQMRVFLVNNPSHLESVDPVVEGFARARQDLRGQDGKDQVLPVLIHGDAAFAGQGIVAETLNMSQLKGYSTGGTIHVVINNQIGYTTLPEDARSTRYSTDVAKMLMVPIFHVYGEDPEAVIHVVRLAADYRSMFHKDVVIDVVCYRRYGHSEGDEPYYTQPHMYARIKARPSLNRLYAEKLLKEGLIQEEEIEQIEALINQCLEEALQTVRGSACPFPQPRFYENWKGFHGIYSHDPLPTGVDRKKLIALSRKLNSVPSDYSFHPKIVGLLKKRQEAVEKGNAIDWANAEALAFASLLVEGIPVRLSGQDSGRGTFSQRHSVLVDAKTEKRYIPLNALDKHQARFFVFDSMLAEAGILGFDYGYAMAQPEGLVIWEAQFGDFANNSQGIVDLYIVSGESKWQRLNGLVMLLPHGFEGMGPEHSSARPERFLQLCAEDNIQVCNPTTASQYFHLLRCQMKRNFRKPLIILSPKSLLRHPLAVSSLTEMSSGSFQEVLDDDINLKSPQRIVLCSGKIYYDLIKRQEDLKNRKTAVLRVEQLYPWPEAQLKKRVTQFRKAKEWCWVQEEPKNMGAWSFMRPLLESVIGGPVEYIGRTAAASPATGFPNIFRQEQAAIIDQAVGSV